MLRAKQHGDAADQRRKGGIWKAREAHRIADRMQADRSRMGGGGRTQEGTAVYAELAKAWCRTASQRSAWEKQILAK